MIKVKYERYLNDRIRKDEEKTVTDLGTLADWIFGQMQQNYMSPCAMYFPLPEQSKGIGSMGPCRIEFKPVHGGENV